ncbi:LexA-binding, inner membrane-associated putative hydrolase [uncultured archaeon]|nr:LexA-binding, inner membrane-associated putative hydrolase [uncultured archaeon]
MLFAAACGAAASYFFFPSQMPAFTLLAAGSGLLPDLDLRKSKGSQLLYAAAAVFALLAAYWLSLADGKGYQEFLLYLAAVVIALAASDWLLRPRHRGYMHSILFLAILCCLCYVALGAFFASALFVGFASHLLADGCIKLL